MEQRFAFDDAIVQQAIGWTIRTRELSFQDWDAFTLWLEADKRHSACYAQICVWDGELAEILPRVSARDRNVEVANRNTPSPSWREHRTRWFALAAGVVLSLGGASTWLLLGDTHRGVAEPAIAVSTRAAERRELAFGSGTQIDVGPESHVVLDAAARRVWLEKGQATFTVRHDSQHLLVVEVGSATVTDVGTVFDVARSGRTSIIGVSRGSVRVDMSGTPVVLAAGEEIRIVGDTAVVGKLDPGSVVNGRDGVHSYRNATVGDVMADIAHVTGKRIIASDRVRRMAFAGSIRIGPNSGDDLARLAPALGLVAVRRNDGWELHAPSVSSAR